MPEARKRILLTITALLALPVSTPAAAETRFGAYGSGGDRRETFRCPEGSAMQGFGGRTGVWIDAIRAMCGPPQADGSVPQPRANGPTFGGTGGGGQNVMCPAGTYFAGAEYTLTAEYRQVANIRMLCRSKAGPRHERRLVFGNDAYPRDRNDRMLMTPNPFQYCPGSQQVIGFDVNFGSAVNAIGMICDNVAPAAAAAAPAPAPAPPPKPVRITTRSNLGPPPEMIGNWSVTPTPGVPFRLVLHDDGQGGIGGEMIGQDGVRGTLNGRIDGSGRNLNFTYRYGSVTGKGMLRIFNAKLIGGSATPDADPAARITWRGNR